ncbi:hypothetical protein ACTFIZ_012737 [Dictyostelium cf. discoideum]
MYIFVFYLYVKIKKKKCKSLCHSIHGQSLIIFKPVVGNWFCYKEINKSILDVNNNEYWDSDDEIEFSLGSFFSQLELDSGSDTDMDTPASEVFDEIWYKDSQFNPIDVVFSQKQLDDIEFMKVNIQPDEYDKHGPKESLPIDILLGAKGSLRDRVVQHVFDLFFLDFLNKLVSSTNSYKNHKKESSQQNDKGAPWFVSYLDFNLDDIKIYLSIFLFAGLNRVTNVNGFWEKPDDSYGAFSVYNPTVANLMSFSRYKAIHKCLRWEGYGTEHQPLPGKADKVGNILWKLVDNKKYIYHFEIEYVVSKKIKEAQSKSKLEPQSTQTQATQINDDTSKSVGNHILKSALNKLEEIPEILNRKYNCIIIDAGYLGGLENVKLLSSRGYYFIVSIASNRTGSVFNFLKSDCDSKKFKFNKLGECRYAQNDKVFYTLTNIPKPIFEEREEQMKKNSRVKNKSTGTFTNQPITTPRFIHLYNHNHNFVDATKMVINPQRNIQRSPNYPRVILNDILYILLNNCMVVTNMFLSKQKESPFSFRELLFHLCNNQLSKISKNNNRLGSKNKIIIPELIHSIANGKPQRESTIN